MSLLLEPVITSPCRRFGVWPRCPHNSGYLLYLPETSCLPSRSSSPCTDVLAMGIVDNQLEMLSCHVVAWLAGDYVVELLMAQPRFATCPKGLVKGSVQGYVQAGQCHRPYSALGQVGQHSFASTCPSVVILIAALHQGPCVCAVSAPIAAHCYAKSNVLFLKERLKE